MYRDLSDTAIYNLPTAGLSTLEVLRLRNVPNLKIFPAVYEFKDIRKAELTYPFHCCAFRFPDRHNPIAYEKHKEFINELEKKFGCGKNETQYG